MDFALLIIFAVVGSCVGSFLNVLIYRMPRGESVVFPSSHCPRCGRAIRWYDNVPLVSWLVLKGRCRFCKEPISPRYLLIEATSAVLVGGLYSWFFILDMREGAGEFIDAWPVFLAHAALLGGLLACSVVDMQHWIVPLEVCWVVAFIGVLSAGAAPHPFMPKVCPVAGAMGLAAVVGMGLAMLLRKQGVIADSFTTGAQGARAARDNLPSDQSKAGEKIVSVGYTSQHGVNPRREILREVVFLTPSIVLACAAYLVLTFVPGAGRAWSAIASPGEWFLSARINGVLSAVLGFVVGGLWVWMTRILGTLGFGREAMGRGDVHILACAGAVTGWIVPSLAFFIAPFFGLSSALYVLIRRNQRELPYGPWLAAAVTAVILFYDGLMELIEPIRQTLEVFFAVNW